MKKRPNILFIMTDEQKANCIGYNNDEVFTPNLNELRSDSINFCNGYTTNPSCVPARAAIFSGKYPSQCGAPAYITPLESNEITFMSRLKNAGYHTAVFGKQHFAGADVEHGYDEETIIDNHYPNFEEENVYTRFLKANGFTKKEELLEVDDKFTWKWITDEKYHVDAFVGDNGAKWIKENANMDKPWFFTISFLGPHQPYNGINLTTESLYDENSLTIPESTQDDLKNKPKYYMDQLLTGSGNPGIMPVINATKEHIRHTLKSYYSTMSFIDQKVGNIINELKLSGQYDNTIIFYTSDHGDYMGEYGMFGKGQYLSQALMRVPLLMKPAIKDFEGREDYRVAYNFDIAPTCLAAAEVSIPKEMTAKSLLPFIKKIDMSQEELDNQIVYLEASNVRGIIRGNYKLIYYCEKNYGELYNLKNDSAERVNLYDNEHYLSIQSELKGLLLDKLIKLGRNSQSPWNYNAPEI